jgi:hypothetical protein
VVEGRQRRLDDASVDLLAVFLPSEEQRGRAQRVQPTRNPARISGQALNRASREDLAPSTASGLQPPDDIRADFVRTQRLKRPVRGDRHGMLGERIIHRQLELWRAGQNQTQTVAAQCGLVQYCAEFGGAKMLSFVDQQHSQPVRRRRTIVASGILGDAAQKLSGASLLITIQGMDAAGRAALLQIVGEQSQRQALADAGAARQ